MIARRPVAAPVHLIVAVADHFEPAILPDAVGFFATLDVQERRLERWCREYPKALTGYRDADGYPLRHTYFYPAEQFHERLLRVLAGHCADGWGEVEIHLHHGVTSPDTAERTRHILEECRDALAEIGCLSRWDGDGPVRYAFVHGNWALANSARGRNCGVDDEMQILAETGCYADFTLPSAPSNAQVRKINALYECRAPLARRAPHRSGRDLEVGRTPHTFPLIVQGPLALHFSRHGRWSPIPRIENSALTANHPPTLDRFEIWRRAAIHVDGRPEWLFVKLHCHGMDLRDETAMFGPLMTRFLVELLEHVHTTGDGLHFVTAREMVNIMLAACDGKKGDPGRYRDYRLRLLADPVRLRPTGMAGDAGA